MKLAKGRVLLGVVAAALAVGVLSNPVPVEAQSQAMRVNIPFAFHVGRETLPAGIYTVRNVSNALWINDGNGHTAVVLTNAIQNRAAVWKTRLFSTAMPMITSFLKRVGPGIAPPAA